MSRSVFPVAEADGETEHVAVEAAGPSELSGWQSRLLPVMSRMVVGLAVFFFLASFAQLIYLHVSIKQVPENRLQTFLDAAPNVAGLPFSGQQEALRLRGLVTLEFAAMERRHHQANVLLMSRVWARYLGFVTGMILALVGCAFVLGRLEAPKSEINANVNQAGLFSVKSASPGIILAFLGVTLMITTIVTHHKIEVTDSAIYVSDQPAKPVLMERPQTADFGSTGETGKMEAAEGKPVLTSPGGLPVDQTK